ncbi:hypothetical protein C0L86_14595 [Streptomyces sp. SCA2-2]|nr:hypothetical protein C0L86_14595 [Streptomyces sp. SCA2-2]
MRPLTRLAATCATTAALLLTGAATASAAAASTPAAPDRTPLTSLYRGVQGASMPQPSAVLSQARMESPGMEPDGSAFHWA